MKFLTLLIAFALAGCGGNPVKTSFPDVPEKLMATPNTLLKLSSDSGSISLSDSSPSKFKLSEISTVISTNYGICAEYKEQIFSLQNWILDQKRLNP